MTPLDLEKKFFESRSALPAVSISGQRIEIKSHWALVAIAPLLRRHGTSNVIPAKAGIQESP